MVWVGHKKGEVASELASSVMEEDYDNLISYVEKANKAIYEYQESNKDSEGMGTTMTCLLYTSPSPRDQRGSRMPSSA